MSKSASQRESTPNHEWSLRDVTNDDADDVIQLIDSVFKEYGDRICLENADSDLLDLEGNYRGRGGRFVVMTKGERIIGTHAILPLAGDATKCTFRRLYLHPDFRGTSAGNALMQWAIDAATQAGFARIEFWSDTRFARAHRFFRRFGFAPNGRTREMHDGHESYREYFFFKQL